MKHKYYIGDNDKLSIVSLLAIIFVFTCGACLYFVFKSNSPLIQAKTKLTTTTTPVRAKTKLTTPVRAKSNSSSNKTTPIQAKSNSILKPFRQPYPTIIRKPIRQPYPTIIRKPITQPYPTIIRKPYLPIIRKPCLYNQFPTRISNVNLLQQLNIYRPYSLLTNPIIDSSTDSFKITNPSINSVRMTNKPINNPSTDSIKSITESIKITNPSTNSIKLPVVNPMTDSLKLPNPSTTKPDSGS